MDVRISAATDLGLKRPQNEDSHGTWIPSTDEERRRRGTLLVVADGMGGSRAGEVASRLAVETVLRCYLEGPGEDPLEDLHHAVEAANRVVHRESAAHPEMSGMGTTCTAVVVREADAYVAHVGDSRAYLIQAGRIRQLTRDHSLVAQLVRDGQLTPEQAKVDPRRNVVTRSVGVGAHVEIDAEHEPGILRPGDTVLVCSDGLHGVVADEELKAAANGPDLEQGCRDAIRLANQRGGPDNITVVLARMVAGDARREPAAGAGAGRLGEADARGSGHAPADSSDAPRPADGAVSGRATPERDENDRTDRAGDGRYARPALAGAPEQDEEEPDEEPPRPYQLREERQRSSTSVFLWLIVALALLVLAVATMTIVLQRMGQQSKRLGGSVAEVHLAWR